jgi:hypothetical protein
MELLDKVMQEVRVYRVHHFMVLAVVVLAVSAVLLMAHRLDMVE